MWAQHSTIPFDPIGIEELLNSIHGEETFAQCDLVRELDRQYFVTNGGIQTFGDLCDYLAPCGTQLQVEDRQSERDYFSTHEGHEAIAIEEFEGSWDTPENVRDPSIPASTNQETVEEVSPLLYTNLWVDDAKKNQIAEPFKLCNGETYCFYAAIEPWPISERSRPFLEIGILKQREKTTLTVEAICPFLKEGDLFGYARRAVDYYPGYGFDPESFLLQPWTPGEYYLTVRVLLDRETLYREILAIEVANAESLNTRLRTEEPTAFATGALVR